MSGSSPMPREPLRHSFPLGGYHQGAPFGASAPEDWCQSVDPPKMSIFTPTAMQVSASQNQATLCSTISSPQQLGQGPISLLRRGPLTASCWLSHCFEYTRESAGEERKEPLPNNLCESAFQRTNRAILSSANFFTIYLGRHFFLNGNVSCSSGNR